MAAPHILIVDDEPGITRLCERLLKRLEYQVSAFTNPEAAMKFVVHNRIDMLLVDTAGLRKKQKVTEDIEFFSFLFVAAIRFS